jgi:hypothetical protein
MLLAANKPNESITLVVSRGYKRPATQAELLNDLNALLKSGNEEVAKDMAEIHPHKGFIMEMIGSKIIGNEAAEKEKEVTKVSEQANCPNKGIRLQERQYNMSDDEIKDKLEKELKNVIEKSDNLTGDKYKVSPKEWIPVVAVAGLFLIGIAVAIKMTTSK